MHRSACALCLCDERGCSPRPVPDSSPLLPGVTEGRLPSFQALKPPSMSGGMALGPISFDDPSADHPSRAGWVIDHAKDHNPEMIDGALRIAGDSRLYLVQDHTQSSWEKHKYVRFDLAAHPLSFTLDLSSVPCGCLATVYLVSMPDPSLGSNYCDMAENTNPGLGGAICTEIDLLEVSLLFLDSGALGRAHLHRNARLLSAMLSAALPVAPPPTHSRAHVQANNNAMQSAIHTEHYGAYGSGKCDKNGCFSRVGGPQSPAELQASYGLAKYASIDTHRPFEVAAAVDAEGALTVQFSQGEGAKERVITTFDRHMAGNPQGAGVPQDALAATKAAMGKLALVASLWASPDNSWCVYIASHRTRLTVPTSGMSSDLACQLP